MTRTRKTNFERIDTHHHGCWALLAAGALALMTAGCLEPDEDPGPVDPLRLTCGAAELHAFDHDACGPMDVVGDGACYCALGYVWDGSACVMLGGCECTGADCDSLAETEEDCLAAHESCVDSTPEEPEEPEEPEGPGFMCGSEALFAADHDRCDAMDATGVGACFCLLGFIWNGTECVGLGGSCECVGADCDSLTHSLEECQAAHAGCGE